MCKFYCKYLFKLKPSNIHSECSLDAFGLNYADRLPHQIMLDFACSASDICPMPRDQHKSAYLFPHFLCLDGSAAGTNNPEHFFVATQDRRLRECLGRVKGGACCFASVNGLHVEEPSGMLKEKASEVGRQHLKDLPRRLSCFRVVGKGFFWWERVVRRGTSSTGCHSIGIYNSTCGPSSSVVEHQLPMETLSCQPLAVFGTNQR